MERETPNTPDAKTQWLRSLRDIKAEKRQRTRLRMERRKDRKRAPIKLVLTVATEKRDAAEKACYAIHGLSLVAFLYAEIKALADSPAGYISLKDQQERKRFSFTKEGDLRAAETIAQLVEENADDFPGGYTMLDVEELWGSAQGDRSTQIMIGRVMRIIGYNKIRTYIPATADTPAKLGWIYRKDADSAPASVC